MLPYTFPLTSAEAFGTSTQCWIGVDYLEQFLESCTPSFLKICPSSPLSPGSIVPSFLAYFPSYCQTLLSSYNPNIPQILKNIDTSIFFRRRQWHPTPVLLPGKSHGWRSLVGCSPQGCQESNMTQQQQQYIIYINVNPSFPIYPFPLSSFVTMFVFCICDSISVL